MRLLIMGPPGAGKGTQAVGIAAHYGIPAVSSGDLFRQHIKDQDDLGRRVSALIANGDFVPDVLTTSMVFRRLLQPDARAGWLLDGYPRTLGQVQALDLAQGELGTHLDAVVSLVADPEALVGRMLKRAQIEGRADDNEETIRHRIDVYEEQTAPVLGEYARRGLVVEVDAIGAMAEVTRRLTEALDARLATV